MVSKALFLDRDGVININHGYVSTIDNFDFIDDVFDLVLRAIEFDYLVIVITNQAGIGRGFYSCLLYTSPSPRDRTRSRMPSSA